MEPINEIKEQVEQVNEEVNQKEKKGKKTNKKKENDDDSNQCPICIEKFNKSQKKPIVCQFCTYTICKNCYQKYCIDQRECKCMNCRKVHSLSFFYTNVSTVFLKGDWNNVQMNKLFELEQAKFPETQMFIEENTKINERLIKINNFLDDLRIEKFNLMNRQKHIQYNGNYTPPNKDAIKCVLPCPNCNGLIMKNFTCGLCKTKVCENCGDVLGLDDHKCDPQKVESLKFITQTTKPCPKCGTRIHKIEGCDQIFCTVCHTAFSYRTGHIETGRIHNPHYYEYLRSISENGEIRREEGDIPIQGCCIYDDEHLIEYYTVIERTSQSYNRAQRLYIDNLYRSMLHIERVEKPNFNLHMNTDRNNEIIKQRDLRVLFLVGRISKKRYETKLRTRQKKIEKSEEVYPILDLIVRVINDELKGLPLLCDNERFLSLVGNMNKLIEISNEALNRSEKILKIKLFRIGHDFSILRERKLKEFLRKQKQEEEKENDE